jgi:hypothetical protein
MNGFETLVYFILIQTSFSFNARAFFNLFSRVLFSTPFPMPRRSELDQRAAAAQRGYRGTACWKEIYYRLYVYMYLLPPVVN